MKRPAFQFYPSDWRNDPALRLCSMGARGLWIEAMCIMHGSEPYGHLVTAGRALDAKGLARLVGESPKAVTGWLKELADNGVSSVTEDGVLYSRRMVRDEDIRERRAAGGEAGKAFGALGAEHGAKGGRPRNGTGDKKPPLKPPPSSSSSSSSSKQQDQEQAHSHSRSEIHAPARDMEPAPTERADAPAEAIVSPGAQACIAMRQAGAIRTNPSHPILLAGIAEGATAEMYAGAIREAIDRGKGEPFAYAITTVRAQLAEAKRSPQEPRHAERSPSRKRSVVERVEANIIERREREATAADPSHALVATRPG